MFIYNVDRTQQSRGRVFYEYGSNEIVGAKSLRRDRKRPAGS